VNTPAKPPASLATTTLPTVGSLVGSASGAAIAALFKVTDPMSVALIVTAVTGVVTALFHWVGVKLDVPALE
jgi:hypothetical protein